MATTEPGISAPASPSDVGRHLRAVRKAKGLSRAEVARSAGLTRRELAAYERGRSPVPDSDLWCLAGSCGVDVGELVPPIERISVGSDLGALTVGESVARLRPVPGNDGVLREYLAMVYELRNLPPGAKPPMREEDLATLAETLGGTPDAIEARLHELIGASREEAARLRSMILPPRPIAAPAPAPVAPVAAFATPMPAPVPVAVAAGAVPPPPVAPLPVPPPVVTPLPPVAAAMAPPAPTAFPAPPAAATPMAPPVPAAFPAPPADLPPLATVDAPVAPVAPLAPMAFPPPGAPAPAEPALPSYPPPAFDFATPATTIGDPDAADRFFSAPHADDPFAPPPPLEALAPAPPGFPAPSAGTGLGFAPPSGPTIDPFAPPAGAPLAETPAPPTPPAPPTDPFGIPLAPSAGNGSGAPSGDPFATAPVVPTRPDGFVADLGTDYPDATLPAYGETFDPVHDSTFAVDVPGPFGGEPPASDRFGGVEMVVLDVGPDGNVVAPPATDAPALADGAPELDDDPFAILRIPIEDVEASDAAVVIEPSPLEGFLVPEAEAGWSTVLEHEAADAPAPDEYVDAFAAAFVVPEPPMAPEGPADPIPADPIPADTFAGPASDEPGPVLADDGTVAPGGVADEATPLGLAGDDDPGDDWFDRAAAAADALIAEQRHDPPLVVGSAARLAVDHPATVEDPVAVDTVDTVEGLDSIEDPVAVVAADPAGPADTDLAPIAWSLGAPAGTPVAAPAAAVPADGPAAGEFVAAGADWQVGGIFPATAMADDGTLALRRADVRWALADVAAEHDFTVRAHVAFTSGAGFGILFRVSTDDTERITGYSFDVDPIYSGGGFLVRQWNDSRQHWKPLAHAPVADPTRLFGAHLLEVSLRNDTLTAHIDGEPVMEVPQLSRCSLDAGHEPCRGGRIGVQAWSTTEVTVDKLLVARH